VTVLGPWGIPEDFWKGPFGVPFLVCRDRAFWGCEGIDPMGGPRKVNVEGVGRLAAFSHATVAGGLVFVSGMLGTLPGGFDLAPGGTAGQTRQALENIRAILAGAGARLEDVVKVNVFLTDMTTFAEMNRAYLAFFPGEPPARITVGCTALALGAAVEMDCIAQDPARAGR